MLSSESSNYNYKKGYILLYSKMDYEKAIPCLQKAILNTSVNYDLYSLHEKNASIDAFYHLGKCYHLNSEFEKAKQYFNHFLISTNSNSDLIYKAHNSILQCDVAKALIARPKKAIVKNIGKEVTLKLSDKVKKQGVLVAATEAALTIETTRVEKIEGKKKKETIVEQEVFPMASIKETKIVISFK